jgi:hypothetical protein
MIRWAIITGEYPPQAGGVSDYTRLVAEGLSAAGDLVTVYAPKTGRPAATNSAAVEARGPFPNPPVPGGAAPRAGDVAVVRLPDHFGPRGLAVLDRMLSGGPRPDRILIQYVPHAYGMKAMNVPFASWVSVRARRIAPVWVMFHEVQFPFRWRPVTHAVLGIATRRMARLVAGAADRVFVSIPAWGDLIRRSCPRSKPAEWLPVPCVVGTASDPAAIATVRARYAPGAGAELVGHFGTFGGAITGLLGPAVLRLLRDRPSAGVLLFGRGSEAYRERFAAEHPLLADRIAAAGELGSEEVAAHVRACDLLLQPYPDGVSSRRTTAMAGLANGVPVATNRGPLSEPVWFDLAGAAVADNPDPAGIAAAACGILDLPLPLRSELGTGAAASYEQWFGLARTLVHLRSS